MPTSCCERFTSEFNPCQDWYCVGDPEGDFDVEATFAPCSLRSVALKVLALCYVTGVFIFSLWQYEDLAIYFGLLTNITLSFSVIYICLSTFNSIVGVEQPRPRDNVSFWVGAQWYMFHLAMYCNLVTVSLYWILEFERDETTLTFVGLSTHGGTCVVLLLEGFGVNFIPIRWFFYWGTGLLFGVGYLVWTLLHSMLDIGNSERDDSDLLYDAVDWEDNLGGTITMFAVTIIIVGPFLQTILFVISIYRWPFCCGTNKRRYVEEKDTDIDE